MAEFKIHIVTIDMVFFYEQSLLLEKSIYDIKMLEMMDNMIESYGMRRLAKALPNSPSILTLSLDYNEYVVKVLWRFYWMVFALNFVHLSWVNFVVQENSKQLLS